MRDDLLPTTYEGKLAKVIEEAGEVLQVCGKILRHGQQAIDPKTGYQYDNQLDLLNELYDLELSIQRFKLHVD